MKESKKVDKGFELQYYKLSYRRRFIRTLWMIPFAIIAVFLCYVLGFSEWSVLILAIVLAIITIVQALHNYKMWKSEEQSKEQKII